MDPRLKGLLHFACFTLAFSIAGFAAQAPNLIYILADDLGYGDLSCYGQRHFTTPHIDRLAAEGVRFTQHYAGSTVCAPSRCALMTGFHTGHAYIRGNREIQPIGQQPIPKDTVTLAKLLRAAGYATGAFGKWGLGSPGSDGEPNAQGFQTFFGYNCQRNAHTYYPTWLFRDREKIELDGKTYSHDLILQEALAFIREHRTQPFFCYLPVTIPHAAMHVPESDMVPFRKKFPQFENTIGKYSGPDVRNPIAAFAAMVTKLDDGVGQVLALLSELNLDENTLVIFTSDNGPHLEGGHQPDFFDSNGPLNGHKRDLTDGGIRVPMIARWPGKIRAGSTSDHISAFWDVLPTACDLAGIPVPTGIDGISFLPTLLGQPQPKHDYLYWEFYDRGGRRAIRMGPWKAVQNNVSKNPDGPILLFNVEKDIGETINLAARHPELIQQTQRIFREAHSPSQLFHW